MKKLIWGMLIFQGITTVTWLILIVPSVLWWKESIAWIVIMSAWANFAGHGAGLVSAILALYEYDKDN